MISCVFTAVSSNTDPDLVPAPDRCLELQSALLQKPRERILKETQGLFSAFFTRGHLWRLVCNTKGNHNVAKPHSHTICSCSVLTRGLEYSYGVWGWSMLQNGTHLCLRWPRVGAEGGERCKMRSQIYGKLGGGQKEKEATCRSKLEWTGKAKTRGEKSKIKIKD